MMKNDANASQLRDELLLKTRALAATAEGITITDARHPDNPIVYVNPGFEHLTGYSMDETIGRNPRFLQGPDTDPDTVEQIRDAVKADRVCTVELLNYRKDGSPFWNRFSVTPVRNDAGIITHYIGVHIDISERRRIEEALRLTNRKLEDANRRMRMDLEAAAVLQRSLLPSRVPKLETINIAWGLESCDDLAGDTLNIILLDDRQVGLYVLDVAGHGVQASLLSVTLNRWLSATKSHSILFDLPLDRDGTFTVIEPMRVAEKLNRLFPMNPETFQYFTIVYGILDLTDLTFRYVSTGHPAPLYVPVGGTVRSLPAAGFPVGFVSQPEYETYTTRLDPGDRLYLFSDGAEETLNINDEAFGTERLAHVLEDTRHMRLQESVAAIFSSVKGWMNHGKLQDDISILSLQVMDRLYKK